MIRTRKTDGWRKRLLAFVRENHHRKFRPGKWDCAMFTAGAIHAMTGVDHARGWRSKYGSLAKGREMLQAIGHEDHVALIAHLFPEIMVNGNPAPSFARVGDVAVVVENGGAALGIVQGDRIWVLRPSGLGTVELTNAVRAFRI